MNYATACKFYKKIKNIYNDRNEYDEFFKYFEKNWLSLTGPDKSLYKYELRSYYGNFDMETTNKNLIGFGKLEDNIFFSNNCCESINHLINSYIAVNIKYLYLGLKKL